MKNRFYIIAGVMLVFLLCGCSKTVSEEQSIEKQNKEEQKTIVQETDTKDGEMQNIEEQCLDQKSGMGVIEKSILENTEKDTSDEINISPNTVQDIVPGNSQLIVIDAGHQAKGDTTKEPIGPGATEMKARVSGGTKGVVSGLAEYQLTLQIALKLQEELIDRGYTVIMTRIEHDVNMSNSERARIANENQADAFIRIHANGSENAGVNGAMTICQTATNPYNGALYEESKSLSTMVLDALVSSTGCKREKVWETDTMSGVNWCQVPVTIVEMGYMTNANEDALMATEEYQNKIALGIANGIERYLENR